ncbi:PIG-L deacetylase family protein [Microbacterium sp. TWP3-1-2b2]|uniref:PIG-L deacetylase family protein n=1 Tax=Microbacterium sp. TWP3-1-2b2 TaxID=2804651 RepID=UPI003CE9E37B
MRIMTVYAHPADTITNCGGTLALHADAGDEIVAVILTHGGRIHPNVYAEEGRKEDADESLIAADRAEIIENKKGELRRAADIIGIGTIEFLDHDDAISVVREDMVDQVAEMIAKHRPDVIIADYPQNPVVTNSAHTIATMTLIAALDRAAQFLKNLDGKDEVNVKQVFLGGLPVLASDALSTYGVRNDLMIDISSVVGRKIAAMDCFVSQGYDGPFARKLIEASNGEFGRSAGVALAEPYVRFRSETRALLPVTDYAEAADPLIRHISYSQFDVRREFPIK